VANKKTESSFPPVYSDRAVLRPNEVLGALGVKSALGWKLIDERRAGARSAWNARCRPEPRQHRATDRLRRIDSAGGTDAAAATASAHHQAPALAMN